MILTLALALMMQPGKQKEQPKTVWPKVAAVTVTASNEDDSAQLTAGGGRVVALSSAEYSRLQKLRQAVADAEKEIAKAHGVTYSLHAVGCGPGVTLCANDSFVDKPDAVIEFRGQFLLINVPVTVPDSAK